MNPRFAVLLLAGWGLALPALAGEEGIYGRLDLEGFPAPRLIDAKPRVAEPPARGAPAYFHVAPGYESRWRSVCRNYDACSLPALFVTEEWFLKVYLPQVGNADGREQRHREHARRNRLGERDAHDFHDED